MKRAWVTVTIDGVLVDVGVFTPDAGNDETARERAMESLDPVYRGCKIEAEDVTWDRDWTPAELQSR